MNEQKKKIVENENIRGILFILEDTDISFCEANDKQTKEEYEKSMAFVLALNYLIKFEPREIKFIEIELEELFKQYRLDEEHEMMMIPKDNFISTISFMEAIYPYNFEDGKTEINNKIEVFYSKIPKMHYKLDAKLDARLAGLKFALMNVNHNFDDSCKNLEEFKNSYTYLYTLRTLAKLGPKIINFYQKDIGDFVKCYRKSSQNDIMICKDDKFMAFVTSDNYSIYEYHDDGDGMIKYDVDTVDVMYSFIERSYPLDDGAVKNDIIKE